ncbi:MAG: hypothetical protein JW803_07210 [Endomicrobiales bacterium]|nr:hypothetical protein [Endomicrobiales bacterium]
MDFAKQAIVGIERAFIEQGVKADIEEYYVASGKEVEVLAQIAEQKPAVIFAMGEQSLNVVKAEIDNIPIVAFMIFGLEQNKPNLTGVTLGVPAEMKLRMIKKAMPGVKKIGFVYSEKSERSYRDLSENIPKFGLKAISKRIESEAEFPSALASVLSEADCFLIVFDAKIYFLQSLKYLLLEGLKNKVPIVGLSNNYTRAGAVLSVECDYVDLGWQAGGVALRVIGGEQPSSIMPLKPRKINYSVNKISASRIGLLFSPEVLKGAGEVFE